MRHVARDLRFAVRSFRRSPIFTAVAVASLALGIGANTAIFSLVDQLILRLLPIRDPQRVVLLAGRGRHYGGNNGRNALSYLMYQDLRDRNQVFSGMMCRYRLSPTVAIGGELVSDNYFPLRGIRPAIGRLFTAGIKIDIVKVDAIDTFTGEEIDYMFGLAKTARMPSPAKPR